ncbi:thioredoxin domain-containing protein 6 isoform X1 [Mirounga leonina]|uniref:thioredoxin domain-containing protein 6 isoform X1 n=1 Tax=Mirounga leonina TaxID=9715 RepID=UPI00156BE95D|nr:thioredoxin domain-containing protein 6 isoform X1 [Mirounga leonina]
MQGFGEATVQYLSAPGLCLLSPNAQTLTNASASESVPIAQFGLQGGGGGTPSRRSARPRWAWLTRTLVYCCPDDRGWVSNDWVGNSRQFEDRVAVEGSFAVAQFPRNIVQQAMGSKKKEIALQVNISTQELWEEMLSSKGLTVVDVYQGWCGPCKPVVSLFQKMRMEVGLDLLHFALAEADCLDVLEKYRGRCEPNFLFYAGGELVAVVRGANAPLLQKTIREQLEAEKKVLAEGRERKVEAFEKLVHHMCSGPSHLLILTRPEGPEDVTAAWRTLMGPCDPDVARREQPDSLRAQFGTEMPFNAVHGSQDRDAASRELALLFPTFKFADEVLEASLGHGAEGAAGPTEARRFPEDMD